MKDTLLNKIRAIASTELEDRFTGVTCPACNYQEAFAYKNNPYFIYCPRQNKCGVKTSTIEYFGIRENVETEYPATATDPNRPARKFLETRGLSRSLEGLDYEYDPDVRGLGCGGVMFPLGKDDSGKEVKSGRIINPPAGEGKTHNIGPTSGKCYVHPGRTYDESKPLFLTEGIIDTLSKIEMKLNSAAIISSNANIANMDLPPHKNLILAFDNDLAGIKATKKAKEIYPEADAILPNEGQDWNDFLMDIGDGEKARKIFDAQFDKFRFNADLAMASSPKKYAELFKGYYNYLPDLFKFNGRYYSGRKTRDGDIYTLKLSDFTISIDHYQKLEDPKSTGHIYRYYLIIHPKKGKPRKIVLEGNELSTTDLVRKAFLSRGKVLWEGDKAATMALSRMIVDAKYAPVVRQMEVVGYDAVTNGYYFSDFGIDTQGNKLTLNKKGFFKVSGHEYVVPLPYPTIKPSDKPVDIVHIYRLVTDAWGNRGALAVAFTVASWFVNVVKPVTAFFPFLSLFGDTQTGKSRLIRLLNYLQAIDEEGMPLLETNTRKGGLRKISQVAGLIKALIEGNSRDNKSFDYSSLLPLYNKGNSLQTTAIKSLDTRTREVPFLGSLIFGQNHEPFKTKAEKERFLSAHFSSDQITEETKKAFDELMKIAPQDLANFIVSVLKHRQQIENTWESVFEKNKMELADIADYRIIENHALVLTFHQLLCDVIGIDYDLLPYIREIAELKKEACNSNDNLVVAHFFDQLNEIKDEERVRFCEVDQENKRVHIHLPEAIKTLNNIGHQQPSSHILTREFRECAAFVNASMKYRFSSDNEKGADGRTRLKRVWVFDITKL